MRGRDAYREFGSRLRAGGMSAVGVVDVSAADASPSMGAVNASVKKRRQRRQGRDPDTGPDPAGETHCGSRGYGGQQIRPQLHGNRTFADGHYTRV